MEIVVIGTRGDYHMTNDLQGKASGENPNIKSQNSCYWNERGL